MTKTLRTLTASALLAGASLTAHAGLVGSTINLTFYFPDIGTEFCSSGSQVVGAGVEYPSGCGGFAPTSIDFGDDGFSVDTGGIGWAAGSFNGFVVDVLSGLDFGSVVYAGGTMGVTSASVVGGDLHINFADQNGGLANFRFTQAGASVSEPASLALAGLALLAAGAARRRRA